VIYENTVYRSSVNLGAGQQPALHSWLRSISRASWLALRVQARPWAAIYRCLWALVNPAVIHRRRKPDRVQRDARRRRRAQPLANELLFQRSSKTARTLSSTPRLLGFIGQRIVSVPGASAVAGARSGVVLPDVGCSPYLPTLNDPRSSYIRQRFSKHRRYRKGPRLPQRGMQAMLRVMLPDAHREPLRQVWVTNDIPHLLSPGDQLRLRRRCPTLPPSRFIKAHRRAVMTGRCGLDVHKTLALRRCGQRAPNENWFYA